jgi:beta-exotoxin I transport system permease protein
LISSLAPAIDWLRPARFISPFFYAVGDNQLKYGLPLAWAGVLAAGTLIFAVIAVVAFNRLDVH